MKKNLLFLLALLFSATVVFAQSPIELAKQQQKQNEFYMKILKTKPNKDAKKEAKKLRKDGWLVPVGEKSIEQQLMSSYLYGEELMADENGAPTKRYIQQTGMQTSGSYNAGYAAARAMAQAELAAMLKTKIAAALQSKLDNAQLSSINAASVDKFNERARFIVDEVLTNCIPVMCVYRELPNHLYQVQARFAFDKKELVARIQRNLQQQLELEGDELMKDFVGEVINTEF